MDLISSKTLKTLCLVYLVFTLVRCQEDVHNHKHWPKDMDEICGQSNADRIIGGKLAMLSQFPWMARLMFLRQNRLSIECGGSLITPRYVLTAGHCLSDSEAKLVSVVLGEHDDQTDPDCEEDYCAEKIQTISVSEVYVHSLYDSSSQDYDISIIKLEEEAQLSDSVMPICLPSVSQKFGSVAEIAGWGITNTSEEMSYSSILKVVKLPILKIRECQDLYSYMQLYDDRHICCGNDANEDSCGGDSGGPLMQMADSGTGPRYYVTGIVSFGLSDCGAGPAVYTRVLAHINFILDSLK